MSVIERYKNCMIMIFYKKYGISNSVARQWINEYDFDDIIKITNNLAMHDDPEMWVDTIYKQLKAEF